MTRYLYTILLVLLFPLCVQAFTASDTVVVQQQIGTDTVPPTTPASIDATPIATTQIDVSWASSTDDQSLIGYFLYRNAVQIATTSLTTYSDTGLTPSTTYTYTVAAYDWLHNVSTTSAPVSTTTFQVVVPPAATSTDTGGGTRLTPRLIDMQIDETQDGALLSWSTNIYVRYTLRWGISDEYELGFVQSDAYRRDHTTRISGLDAGVTYQYELVGYNQLGRAFILEKGSFTTKEFPDTEPPANVLNARLLVEGFDVFISWDNPADADFAKVRVVRNPLFYPELPHDGFIVYEGSGTSMLDPDVLRRYEDQYYTIFAYDRLNNVSSGVILKARANVPFPGTNERGAQAEPEIDESRVIETGDAIVPTGSISFADVLFEQQGVYIEHDHEQVLVHDDAPLSIELPIALFPRHLKTITVTLAFADQPPQTYLLRADTEKKVYAAKIGRLVEGIYGAQFSVYNHTLQKQDLFEGDILVVRQTIEDTVDWTTMVQKTAGIRWWYCPWILFVVLCSILWWFIVVRRSREDN